MCFGTPAAVPIEKTLQEERDMHRKATITGIHLVPSILLCIAVVSASCAMPTRLDKPDTNETDIVALGGPPGMGMAIIHHISPTSGDIPKQRYS